MMATKPTREKLVGIEVARGIAASMVVAYHAARHIEKDGGLAVGGAAQFGHAGVDFFFVLSGFIIFFVHWADIGKPTRLAQYTFRRLTRVLPLYWLVMGLR